MTAALLFACFCIAILTQIILAICFVSWRRSGIAAETQSAGSLETSTSSQNAEVGLISRWLPTLKDSLFAREVLPFYLSLILLTIVTLLIDALLHFFNAVWIGRYLGIPGVLLILGSFGYSLRKRKIIESGRPVELLRLHERMAWAGSLLVLVHAGIHFNSILAWLAVWAMLINVASGLTGKFLQQRSRKQLENARQQLQQQGLPAANIEERLHWDSLTFDVIRKWRVIHYPIALAFTVLATAHILAIFLFWGWK
jgi:hypothetical protein